MQILSEGLGKGDGTSHRNGACCTDSLLPLSELAPVIIITTNNFLTYFIIPTTYTLL